MVIRLQNSDYPSLFRESDRLSTRAQSKHFLLVRIKIAFLVAATLILAFPWKISPIFRLPATIVAASLLVILIFFTSVMETKKFDREWINYRAVAEKIKTESWLFMMKAAPYADLSEGEVETIFLNRIQESLRYKTSIASKLTLNLKKGPQVTDHMKRVRESELLDRRNYYIQNRLSNQRLWYASKADWNRKRESLWFIFAGVLDLVAALAAIILIVLPDTVVDPVAVVTAAGAGVLSWLNARNYSEPAESYGIVAQDLVFLEEQASRINPSIAGSEEALAKIVEEVEGIITGEQRIWLARL